jgi:ubiquinone/menaquinone biosynthesis C-methylase UbiE
MVLPEQVQQFIGRNGVDEKEVLRVVSGIEANLPDCRAEFDIRTYEDFGVLRVVVVPNMLEPLLFGSIPNLTRLSQALWDSSAGEWHEDLGDVAQRGTFLKRIVLIPAVLEAVHRHHAKGALLDLGCGDGILFRELIKKYEDVWGADFAPSFIEQLRIEFPALSNKLLVQDATRLSIDRKFSTVVASALFLGIPDIETALRSVASIIAEGGCLVVADVHSAYHRSLGYFDADRLVRIHDSTQTFRIEKMVGGGRTKAIHNHHPPDLYRRYLEDAGMTCVEDTELKVTASQIDSVDLPAAERARLRETLRRDEEYPPFRILVFRK